VIVRKHRSSAGAEEFANSFQEHLAGGGIAGSAGWRKFARGQSGYRKVGKSFVAQAAGFDKTWVAANNGIVRRFAGARLENPLPQDGLGILEITLNKKFDLFSGGSEVDDRHVAAEAMEDVIAGADDAAGRIENELALRILFEVGEDFVEDVDLFREVLGLAFRIGGTVGPAHPRGDAIDAGVPARFEDWSEAEFDLVVTADGGTTEDSEILGPVGFAGTGHADQGKAKRLIRMRPHREPTILREDRRAKKYKREELRREVPVNGTFGG